jgi:hypothetical protein
MFQRTLDPLELEGGQELVVLGQQVLALPDLKRQTGLIVPMGCEAMLAPGGEGREARD